MKQRQFQVDRRHICALGACVFSSEQRGRPGADGQQRRTVCRTHRLRGITLVLLLAVFGLTTQASIADIPEQLRLREEHLHKAWDSVSPAIVGVSNGFGVGSGVVVSKDGLVLTASHVVETRSRRRTNAPAQVSVMFADGTSLPAEVLGKNRDADAAMLRISRRLPNDVPFPFVELGKSAEVKPGDWCFAAGHPGGFQQNRGAPLRLGRILSTGHRTLVSDCPIVLGDSGGPLFDMDGRLIGIHSMITNLIIENRHAAIDCWHRDWERFLRSDQWGRLRAFDNELIGTDFFGVSVRWKDFIPEVKTVLPDSPADRAGLRPGDRLVSIGGERFADRLDLGTVLALLNEEQSIQVELIRNQNPVAVSLITGTRDQDDDDPPRHTDDTDRQEEFTEGLGFDRRIGPFEERAPEQLALFSEVVAEAHDSIVTISDGGLVLTFGTIVSSDGDILTKASMMEGAIAPEVLLSSGRRFRPKEMAVDYVNDVMLLHISAEDLKPVPWETEEAAEVGDLAIIQDSRGNPRIPTVVSVAARKLDGADQAFLGITMNEQDGRILITGTVAWGSAARNGLREGDLIEAVDGVVVRTPEQLKHQITSHKPGETVTIRYLPKGKTEVISLELRLTQFFRNQDALLDMYTNPENRESYANNHAGGYPLAIQIDADIFPKECGGPLLNLNGKAIGMNIARADRVVAYALPSSHVLKVYANLQAEAAEKKTQQSP
ncbi:MAG: trypsin-like peptidase domain-containing protein [Planctomycetaceae bacterium]|nr:trypsin-like peptidase domain-containing protein [Planctomycetaceae bacterium]